MKSLAYPPSSEQMNGLFMLMKARYEANRSTIITTKSN